MKKTVLSSEQLRELASLARRPDHEIDTDDIPEAPAENWRHARRGARPRLVTPTEADDPHEAAESLKPTF